MRGKERGLVKKKKSGLLPIGKPTGREAISYENARGMIKERAKKNVVVNWGMQRREGDKRGVQRSGTVQGE